MTRWLAVVVVVVVVVVSYAGSARADGFVKLGVELATKPQPPPPANAAAPPEARSAPTPDAAATEPQIKVGLFPERALARNPRPDLVYVPSTPVEAPPRQGFSLGDDRDWRVEAARIGAMAGAFAALVALCGDGKCMW